MKIYEQLSLLQNAVKAPKDNTATVLGGFAFRNAESILQAAKSVMPAGCGIVILEETTLVGDWHYMKSTATFYNAEGETIQAIASAREMLAKKGLDDSQVSGLTSSYANKRSLGNLLMISGEADADSDSDWSTEVAEYHALIVAAQAAPESDRDAECCDLFLYVDGYEVEAKQHMFHAYMDEYAVKGKKVKLKEAIKILNDQGFAVLDDYAELVAKADDDMVAGILDDLNFDQATFVKRLAESKKAGA